MSRVRLPLPVSLSRKPFYMLFQSRASRRVEELIQELVTAAEEGDICTVRSLVERDVPLDCEDVFMHTALVGASSKGHIDVVRYLLENGADVNVAGICEDFYERLGGDTALMYASAKGHSDVVEALIENGADVNEITFLGWTALTRACSNGQINVVRLLVEKGADVNLGDKQGVTPLMFASDMNHVDIVRFLIQHGANVQAEDDEGKTALDYAQDDSDSMEILTT